MGTLVRCEDTDSSKGYGGILDTVSGREQEQENSGGDNRCQKTKISSGTTATLKKIRKGLDKQDEQKRDNRGVGGDMGSSLSAAT